MSDTIIFCSLAELNVSGINISKCFLWDGIYVCKQGFQPVTSKIDLVLAFVFLFPLFWEVVSKYTPLSYFFEK